MRLVKAGQTAAARRRVYFQLVLADGISPALAEAGGQPEASADGAAWSAALIGTLTHVGNGRYYADLTLAAVAAAGTALETRYKGAATAECPGDSVRVVAFDPDDADALGLSKLLQLALAQVTFSGPVLAGGDVLVYAGDSYYAADGRALEWTSPGTWPDLTGAAVAVLTFPPPKVGGGATLAGSVVTPAGPSARVRLELSAAQTAALVVGSYGFRVVATLANGHPVSLVDATWTAALV